MTRGNRLRFVLLAILVMAATFPSTAFDSNARPIPIARLLALPDRHDGQETITVGFLVFADRENVLYASKDDARYAILPNSIEIEIDPVNKLVQKLKSMNGSYVMLFGTYRAPMKGSQRVASGRFTNVINISPISEWGREGELPFP